GQIQVRRLFLTQRVKSRDLYSDFGILGEIAELIDVFLPYLARNTKSRQMINDHRRFRKAGNDFLEYRQELWIDEGTDRQAKGGSLTKHHVECAFRKSGRSFRTGNGNSEASRALSRQAFHFLLDRLHTRVDDSHTSKDIGRFSDDIEHVLVVGPVIAHLDKDDAVDTAGTSVSQNLTWKKFPQCHFFPTGIRGKGVK